jgi:hypothetical protein
LGKVVEFLDGLDRDLLGIEVFHDNFQFFLVNTREVIVLVVLGDQGDIEQLNLS